MATILTSAGAPRFETPVNIGSKRVFKLMGDDYITLNFSVREPVKFALGDYCDVPGFGRFELCKPYKPNYNTSTGGYDYELKLEAQHVKWRNKIMRYLPQVGGSEASFTLTAPASVHMEMVAANVNALAAEVMADGTTTPHPGYLYNGISQWEAYVDDTVEASAKTVTYDKANILDALTSVAEAFDCEWWVNGNVICLGKCEESNEYVDLVLGGNVSEMAHNDSSESLVTRVLAFGSDRNISARYRKDLIFTVTEAQAGGRRISDGTRVLNADWFPAEMKKAMPGTPIGATLDASLLATVQTGQQEEVRVGGCERRLSTATAGSWSIDASGLVPVVQATEGWENVWEALATLTIVGTDSDGEQITLYEEEWQSDGSALEEGAAVSFSGGNMELDKDMAPLAVKLDFYLRMLSDSSAEIKVSAGEEPRKVLLTRQETISRVEGLTIDRIADDGSVEETYAGAVLNPDYEESRSAGNVIQLQGGTPMAAGQRFTIREIIKSKVKSSYFTSRYSAYSGMANVVANGVVTSRLMIPLSYGKPYVDYVDGLSMEEGVEDVVVFEDIYPKAVCAVTSIEEVDRKETVNNDDGTTSDTVFTAFKLKDDFFTAERPFDKDYILPGKTLEIVFMDGKRYEEGDEIPAGKKVGDLVNPNSGKLNGWTFEVQFTKDSDGSAVWEIVRDSDSGVPNEFLRPEIGDTFAITGCDMAVVDDLYADSAEQELLEKAIKYLKDINTDPSTYDCTIMPVAIRGGLVLGLGKRVNLVHPAYFDCVADGDGRLWGRKSRVIGYELNLDIPYDNPVYTIGNKAQYSRIGQIEDDIEALKVSMNSMPGSSSSSIAYNGQTAASAGSVYVIGVNDSTPASEINVFSALRSRAEFTMRDVAEKVKRAWTFLKGLRVGSYVQGFRGAAIDADGNAEVESITVRSYMKVFELIYNRLNALEGNTSFADVGTIESVTQGAGDSVTVTLRKRWEGDFTAFQPGDVVYGYVNNLNNGAASEHVKAWAWVKSMDREANSLVAVPYPDSETPAGINHPLTPNMVITRWGNNIEPSILTYSNPNYRGSVISKRGEEYINIRQSSFYISCEDGNIVELMGVNKPILEAGNYGTVLGKIPDGLLDSGTEELVNKDQPYLFARGIIVQDLIRVDYRGVASRTANYRGTWSYQTACDANAYYRSGLSTYDTVTWAGNLWQCVAEGNTDEPSEETGSWVNMTGNGAELCVWQIFPNADIITIRYYADSPGSASRAHVSPAAVTCEVLLSSTGGNATFTTTSGLAQRGVRLMYSLDGSIWEEFTMGTDEPIDLEDGTGVLEAESSTDEAPEALTLGGDDVSADQISDRVYFELRSIEDETVLARAVIPVVRDGISYVGAIEWYQWGDSSEVPPAGEWSDGVVPPRPDDASYRYLWNYEQVMYSDGHYETTEKHCISSDGKEIDRYEEYYMLTAEFEQPLASDEGWGADMPEVTDEYPFLWNKEIVYYSDGTSSEPNIHLIAKKGASFKRVVEWYQWHNSAAAAPTGAWSTSMPPQPGDTSYRFLWNYEDIYDSEGRKTSTTPHLIGTDGRGIKSVDEYYIITHQYLTPAEDEDWDTDMPELTDECPYLWNKEVVTYTDNETSTTIRLLAARGVSYAGTDEYYQWGVSSVTIPTGTWSKNTIPSRPGNLLYKYLWNYEVVLKSDGTYSSTAPHVIGSEAKEISSFLEMYMATDTMDAPAETNPLWSTSICAPTAAAPYLWNKETVTYSDGTADVNIRLIAVRGSDGSCFTIVGTAYAHYQAWSEVSDVPQSVTILVDGEGGAKAYTAIYSQSWATTEAVDGDGYVITDTHELFVAKGEQWISLGVIKGEKGDKGDPGEKGDDGRDGLMAYPAGYFDPAVLYTATAETTPVVMYGENYFVLRRGMTYRGNDMASDRNTPSLDVANGGDDARWQMVDRFNAIFADIVMANFAKLSSAVFYGNWMISQQGTLYTKTEHRYKAASSMPELSDSARIERGPSGWSTAYPSSVASGESVYMITAPVNKDDTLQGGWVGPVAVSSAVEDSEDLTSNSLQYPWFKNDSFEPNFKVNFYTGDMSARRGEFSGYLKTEFTPILESDATLTTVDGTDFLKVNEDLNLLSSGYETDDSHGMTCILLPADIKYAGTRVVICAFTHTSRSAGTTRIRPESGKIYGVYGVYDDQTTNSYPLADYVEIQHGVVELLGVPNYYDPSTDSSSPTFNKSCRWFLVNKPDGLSAHMNS